VTLHLVLAFTETLALIYFGLWAMDQDDPVHSKTE